MNINKRRITESEDEDNSTKKNKYWMTHKTRRIIKVESSSDDGNQSKMISQNFDSTKENREKYKNNE